MIVRLFAATPPDDRLAGLVRDLQAHPQVDVIGVGETGRETVDAIRTEAVDALLFAEPLSDLARAIRVSAGIPIQTSPTMVLASGEVSQPLLVTSLAHGFDAVLPIDDTPDAVTRRLTEIVNGEHRLSGNMLPGALAVEPGLLAQPLVTDDPLDQQVADLVGSGLSDQDIAQVTGRSIQDVRNRIENLMAINHLATRTHLAIRRAAHIVVPDFQ